MNSLREKCHHVGGTRESACKGTIIEKAVKRAFIIRERILKMNGTGGSCQRHGAVMRFPLFRSRDQPQAQKLPSGNCLAAPGRCTDIFIVISLEHFHILLLRTNMFSA